VTQSLAIPTAHELPYGKLLVSTSCLVPQEEHGTMLPRGSHPGHPGEEPTVLPAVSFATHYDFRLSLARALLPEPLLARQTPAPPWVPNIRTDS
jgi:hypothetical protein